jgi:hypothetical protein
MWCVKCQHDLTECTCPDLPERLQALIESGSLAYRKCSICDLHYALCKCPNPVWVVGGLSKKEG